MARILDFYAVRWEYEPDTFPILWNLEGDVVESFSPDFYLPDLDLYLEMTTLRQKLVRKKNRKLRRLRELYPDINDQAVLRARLPGADAQVRQAARWPTRCPGRPGRSPSPARRSSSSPMRRTRRSPGRSPPVTAALTSGTPAGRAVVAADRPPTPIGDAASSPPSAPTTSPRRRAGDPRDEPRRPDLHDDVGEILLTEDEIAAKVARARRARSARDYAGRPADPRVGAQGLAPVHGRPDARDRPPVRIDLMEVSSYGGVGDRVVRARADPEGPVGRASPTRTS